MKQSLQNLLGSHLGSFFLNILFDWKDFLNKRKGNFSGHFVPSLKDFRFYVIRSLASKYILFLFLDMSVLFIWPDSVYLFFLAHKQNEERKIREERDFSKVFGQE